MIEKLFDAIKEKNIEQVRELLADPTLDVNQTLPNKAGEKMAALHLAVVKGFTDVVDLLLACERVNVQELTNRGNSALSCAVIAGHIDLCERLLSQSNVLQLNATNKYLYFIAKGKAEYTRSERFSTIQQQLAIPTFVRACTEGNLELVKKMVAEKVDINGLYKNISGLMMACCRKNKELINFLLSLDNIDVTKENDHGSTALHFLFVNRMVDGEPVSSELSTTWSKQDLLATVRQLIEKGADINKQSYSGCTPISTALIYNNINGIDVLIRMKADTNIKYLRSDGSYVSLLDLAKEKRQVIYNILFSLKYNKKFFPDPRIERLVEFPEENYCKLDINLQNNF